MTNSEKPPGPPAPPLVPGHLGAPDERLCESAYTVLAVAMCCVEEGADPEIVRLAENRIYDIGVTPQQILELGRRRIREGRWPTGASLCIENVKR